MSASHFQLLMLYEWVHLYDDTSFLAFRRLHAVCILTANATLSCLWLENALIYIYKDTEILQVNLFAFAYRLFHEDFSPIFDYEDNR